MMMMMMMMTTTTTMMMMIVITIVLRMMIKMMKRFFGVCLGGLGVLWAPFGAVLGHFEVLQERSNTKQKVERTRNADFPRMSRAELLLSSFDVSKRALQTVIFQRMSRAKRPFPNIRAMSRPIATYHFFEDVSSESPMF